MRVRKTALLLAGHLKMLAYHYAQLGLWCRDSVQTKRAKEHFWKAFRLGGNPRYVVHALRASFLRNVPVTAVVQFHDRLSPMI